MNSYLKYDFFGWKSPCLPYLLTLLTKLAFSQKLWSELGNITSRSMKLPSSYSKDRDEAY